MQEEEEEPTGAPATGKENGRAPQQPAAGQKRSIDTAGASAAGAPVPKRCAPVTLAPSASLHKTLFKDWQG